jgi:inner membrane protein
VDNVTHTLVGVCLANAFCRRRLGRATVPILAVASNLPDVDALVVLSGSTRSVLERRTFGHSLLLLPFWILLLSLLVRRLAPHLRFVSILAMCTLGAGVHLLFDLVNSFGVVLLWPLSDWRPELATVFIIDFILTGLLAAPLLLYAVRSWRPHLQGFSRAALVAVCAYLALCAGSRRLAAKTLDREAERFHDEPLSLEYLFPEPLGPHRWRGVLREGDVYHLYLIHSMSGRLESYGWVRSQVDDPAVEAARQSRLGQRLERFFKAPVWEVSGGSGPATVSATDLRFRSLVLERGSIFVFRFKVDSGGKVSPGS